MVDHLCHGGLIQVHMEFFPIDATIMVRVQLLQDAELLVETGLLDEDAEIRVLVQSDLELRLAHAAVLFLVGIDAVEDHLQLCERPLLRCCFSEDQVCLLIGCCFFCCLARRCRCTWLVCLDWCNLAALAAHPCDTGSRNDEAKRREATSLQR